MRPGVRLFAVEVDRARAEAARALFADDPDVSVFDGGWEAALSPEAPFDFILVEGAHRGEDVDRILTLAAPRATVVVPLASTEEREHYSGGVWLAHPRLDATSVSAGENAPLIVAVVRG
jgi:protein-L-isoaspartate O-methyltransferase